MVKPLPVLLQYLLPKQALTALAGKLAAAKAGAMTTSVIRWFVGQYRVDMSEAAESNVTRYETFNDFFTRSLKAGVRPIANAALVCPVDGAISQCGPLDGEQLLQAKGHAYSTAALVGGDRSLGAQFTNGHFATIYLSPRDYHRIHMPCDGQLTRMIYVPGALFSVNPTTAQHVPGLFARNERVVCVFESAHGPFVMVLVGATIVGSMATVWHGVVNATRTGQTREWHYDASAVSLPKGAEMGRFLLGSTVVLLFPQGRADFPSDWQPARAVRMGEVMSR
ncbi:MAG: phosphatidylserine decarboxylase [Phycisphaerae bacterium]|nr:phosphatidylserine decarboxylase [Gemmatimonadaceae bacterium]